MVTNPLTKNLTFIEPLDIQNTSVYSNIAQVFVYHTKINSEHFLQFAWLSKYQGLYFWSVKKDEFTMTGFKNVLRQSGFENYKLISASSPKTIIESQIKKHRSTLPDDIQIEVKQRLDSILAEKGLDISQVCFDFNIKTKGEYGIVNLFIIPTSDMIKITDELKPLELNVLESLSNILPQTFLASQNQVNHLDQTLCLYVTEDSCMGFFTDGSLVKSYEFEYQNKTAEELYQTVVEKLAINNCHNILFYYDYHLSFLNIPETWTIIDNRVPLIPLCIAMMND